MAIQPGLKHLTYPERCRIYASEEYQFALQVAKYARRVARAVQSDMKLDTVVQALIKQRRGLDQDAQRIPKEERLGVTIKKMYQADRRQGLTPSYYDAELRALSHDAENDAIRSKARILEEELYKRKKLHVKNKLGELVPEGLRETVACALRQMIGYAPSFRVAVLPRPKVDDMGRYHEVALVSEDWDPDEEVLELLEEDQGGSCAKTTRRRGKGGGRRKHAYESDL